MIPLIIYIGTIIGSAWIANHNVNECLNHHETNIQNYEQIGL